MSIQRLPEDVVAQIKSSTAITSLNEVICGLLKNSLDAGATKLNISVDYAKGNCSVEDNGIGILPAEFTTAGGLGKLHYTSHFPIRSHIHGNSGTFLASVAALSLLSITSHHKDYRSHNTIQIHNSKVLARHIPSPPDQRLLTFSHGTRITVRDLFGSMPVRVKQRSLTTDKSALTRDWEYLKASIVALLLPWPGQATISVRDSASQQTATIRNKEAIDGALAERARRSLYVSRVSSLLYQAGLSEENVADSWVALKAAAGSLSMSGAVCLTPVATKRMQFISIGIQPVSNERGSNVLYEEVNRLFANSGFGVEEEINNIDEPEKTRRAEDRRYKSEGYTDRELKARKGINRWPMFHISIDVDDPAESSAVHDLRDILDERRNHLSGIIDVLRAMIYEFLKRHNFRPVYYNKKKRQPCKHFGSRIPPEAATSALPSRPRSQSGISFEKVKMGPPGDLATSRLYLPTTQSPASSQESPFDGWLRIKSGRQTPMPAKDIEFGVHGEPSEPRSSSMFLSTKRTVSSDSPLFNDKGELRRVPFLDVEEHPEPANQDHNSDMVVEKPEEIGSLLVVEKDIVWTNPATKRKSTIDARTGFVIQPEEPVKARSYSARPSRLTSTKRVRTEAASRKSDCTWIEDLLSSWKNPVFEAAEPQIPAAFDEARLISSMNNSSRNSHHCRHLPLDNIFNVEAKVSKDALRAAEVLAQVDRKFILAKAPLEPISSTKCPEDQISLLIVIDQHAADERCRVEALMASYFNPGSSGAAQTETLDKFLQYEISTQERSLFERHESYFEHWGIEYQLNTIASRLQLQSIKFPSFLKVTSLPPSIAERCQTEPQLLISLLRKEAWKLDDSGRTQARRRLEKGAPGSGHNDEAELHWLARFHGCPQGILELINSRACRSAIMFNDPLSLDECKDLLRRLADCAFPFQCAHGRPSMVPLVDMGDERIYRNERPAKGTFGKQFKRWKASMIDDHS
ncbi:hypothetical protein BKA67DRAFT_525807 [Truncatella angustata]|uniref:MutL C-terminal dimerisation domain-containing protein n=1 Tax=Truncatella angustata TaxID=152316 RepID=A0A9P8UCD4_9PEZI|nr:uncharacterized protein BKA67DRAFT_525807 [Truncatella angustata]KAH6646070.1 hypothetical protein BKA67DRAFT_525807 [Truncatella angustata]